MSPNRVIQTHISGKSYVKCKMIAVMVEFVATSSNVLNSILGKVKNLKQQKPFGKDRQTIDEYLM